MSDLAARPPAAKGVSLWTDAWRRLRQDRIAMLCLLGVAVYMAVALVAWAGEVVNDLHADGRVGAGAKRFADAALFAGHANPDQDAAQLPPSWEHPFGTDLLGREVVARVAMGANIALRLAFSVAAIAVVVGAVFGALAGWFGRVVDELVTWLYSTVSSIPDLMLMVAIAYAWGERGFGSMLVAMSCTYWVGVTRVVRAEFIRLRDRDFVVAARALGLSNSRIMFLHILPNVSHLLIVLFTLLFVTAIKAEVVLSFIGIGIVDQPSWGRLIADSESELMNGHWWQMTFTSVALFGIILALQVLGDALRDAFDPRLRK